MEDTHPDIPPVTRISDKRIERQAFYSFVFILLLAVISLGAYFLGTKNGNAKVLGTEVVATPSPYPTLPPIPTLIPTTPTPTLTPTPTPKIQITIKPLLKNPHVFQLVTPTPTPLLIKKVFKQF